MRKVMAESTADDATPRHAWSRRLRRACACSLLLAACCLLLAGCAGGNQRADNTDPLLGVAPTRALGQPTSAVKPGASANAVAPPTVNPAVPPTPAISSAPAIGSLAVGQPPRYDTDNSLRINTPPGNPVRTSNGGTWQGTNPTAAVQLKGDASPHGANVVPVSSGSPRASSYEQAQAMLAQRGVAWQSSQTLKDGQWEFSCSVPNPQNKHINRTYTGRGHDLLTAMQAVLDQMDKDKR